MYKWMARWPGVCRKLHQASGNPDGKVPTLLVFLPALDLYLFELHPAEGIDECACQACIGNQRDIVVDCRTADFVSVGQLPFAMVFRYVDDQLEDMFAEHLHDVVFSLFIGPAYSNRVDSIVI